MDSTSTSSFSSAVFLFPSISLARYFSLTPSLVHFSLSCSFATVFRLRSIQPLNKQFIARIRYRLALMMLLNLMLMFTVFSNCQNIIRRFAALSIRIPKLFFHVFLHRITTTFFFSFFCCCCWLSTLIDYQG